MGSQSDVCIEVFKQIESSNDDFSLGVPTKRINIFIRRLKYNYSLILGLKIKMLIRN